MTDSSDNTNVVGIDGLSDTQREGARLAASGWQGVDIAEHLGVTQETVSRWRRKPEYIRAIEGHLASARVEVTARIGDMIQKALDVVEDQMDYQFDRALKLRAAIALLQLAGVGRTMTAATKGARSEGIEINYSEGA